MAEFKAGQLLRIFVNERDSWQGTPLYAAIVEMLKREHVAGASVFRGVEGFGAHHEIHLAKIWSFGCSLPVLIEVVDDPAKIESLLPLLETMIAEGAITLERVEYCRFARERGKR
jgi:PII-like signaling protein